MVGDPNGGFWCRTVHHLSQFWDWVDERQIDAHAVNAITMYGTVKITTWAMRFAENGDRPGIEVAAIIAAVSGPWAVLQAALVKFVFEARKGSFSPK